MAMENSMSLQDIRKNYALRELDTSAVLPDPTAQFQLWMQEALTAQADEATAMTLSTADAQGRPSARVVLLKSVDPAGFVFYTNYESRKGCQLLENPFGALTFFWPILERQVRVEGRVEKVPEAMSDQYYQSRPLGSQIGAWSSPQSQSIASRAVLVEKETETRNKFDGLTTLPRPANWGGFNLIPDRLEFWQGRQNRLHDRVLYVLADDGKWQIERLAP